MKSFLQRVLLTLGASIALSAVAMAADMFQTQANVPVEISFKSDRLHADPSNEMTVDVVFTDPKGVQHSVPAFWDGGSVWRVRYASPLIGAHAFRSTCSDSRDHGLNGIHGSVTVTAYQGSNPLFKHGQIRIAPDRRHFEYSDGTPFFWFGDTWWMGLAKRLRWPDEFQALTRDRVKKGFNVIQIVAGLYPDMGPFDPRGMNEAGFPWEKDYARVNPAYFDLADERLRYLIDHGITPCIVGSWGFYMTWMGVGGLERHWRNLIARYGAMPVVWCGCGEVDMPWYLSKRGEYNRQDRMRDWTEVVRYIRQTDPFHRLLTLHPDGASARATINDASLLDFDMLQSGHGLADGARGAADASAATYAASPVMPFVDGESSYENLNNQIPAAWTRATFWISMLDGAAGHTYGANGIWQNNRPGDPHGQSPLGNNWGTLPSRDAMHLPGSTQESLGKKLFEKYPWPSFEPHREWVSYQDKPGATLAGSQWIWFPEGNPRLAAPIAARYFRFDFTLSPDRRVTRARLTYLADDAEIGYFNGHKIGESKDWNVGARADHLERYLSKDRNVIAIRAENIAKADVEQNPAGLVAVLEISYADGTTDVLRTSSAWKCSRDAAPDWTAPTFDDATWSAAMPLGAFGIAPWGQAGADTIQIPPVAAGVDSGVRMAYMVDPKSVVLHDLSPGARYSVKLFDPVTGKTTDLGAAKSDNKGDWPCAPPAGWNHDWVLILHPFH